MIRKAPRSDVEALAAYRSEIWRDYADEIDTAWFRESASAQGAAPQLNMTECGLFVGMGRSYKRVIYL